MNIFFDTSALVKFCHEGEGTEAVTDLILDANIDWYHVMQSNRYEAHTIDNEAIFVTEV